MTFFEKPNKKAVHYLLTVLNAELWAKSYVPDDDFNKKQKLENTVKYLKNVIKNNYVLKVEYFKSDKDTLGIGRQYGNGIQNIPSAFRGLLFRENTTDIDMINAHPTLLRHLCRIKQIPCPNLDNYCENRSELIADGEATKKEVVVSMYSTDPISTSSPFMRYFDIEVKTIKQILWNDLEFKYIRDTIHPQKPNKLGTFMAYLLQSMERTVLGYVKDFMNENKIEVCADMFDGLLVYGSFDRCEELNEYVLYKSAIPIHFATKTHDDFIQIPEDFIYENDDELYASLKEHYETEKGLAFIEETSCYSYKSNNHIIFLKKGDMAQTLQPVKIGKQSFFAKWCDDPSRKTYACVGVYPHDRVCPPNVLNLWTGFYAERITQYETVDVEFLLHHIKIMCNHNDSYYNFVLDWIANRLQYPSSTTLLINFYTEAGGTGKGSLIDIIKAIIGKDKYLLIDDITRLFTRFNDMLNGIVLCHIDEMSAKDLNPFYERFKALITSEDITVETKGQKGYTIKNTIGYISTTQHALSFKIKGDDRRIWTVESSSELKKNTEYFDKLRKMLEDDNAVRSLYDFFMSRPVKKQLTDRDYPITELMEDSITLSRDPIEDFMIQLQSGEYSSEELYVAYKQYIQMAGLEFIVSLRQFQYKFSKIIDKYNITKHKLDNIIEGKRTQTNIYKKV